MFENEVSLDSVGRAAMENARLAVELGKLKGEHPVLIAYKVLRIAKELFNSR